MYREIMRMKFVLDFRFVLIQFSSAIQSCPTLWDPMDCIMPGFPVLHYLPKFAQSHIQSMMPSNHLILCRPFSFCPQSFPESGSCPVSQLFASDGQSIRASASASVLPMTIQGWFPLGWTGLISLLSTGLSSIFFSITARKHQSFSAQPSLWSNS